MDTSFSSRNSSSTGFLLASRRAFTSESSLILSKPSLSSIIIRFTENGAQVVDLKKPGNEISETPQAQSPPLSPHSIRRNPPATYKERLRIHTLRHMAGFTLNTISTMI
jgi:hypothetical protein